MYHVTCCVWNRSIPLAGYPALPFIDQGRAGVTDGRKRKKTKGRDGPSKVPSLLFPLSLLLLTWQTMLGIAHSLIMTWPALASLSKWLRPILHRRTVQCARVPSCDPTGSRRGSDHTLVTVDDVSLLLDRSGCHMLLLVSTSKG